MERNYIRFDWATKRLLRDKANFEVLEGFLTVLLGEKITINKLLESESNREYEADKLTRMDILAEDSKGELIIIEVQNNNEYSYFQRMLFGTSKLVTEYIEKGQDYDSIRKIYAVNIVYFRLGSGTDTVYHGKTEFKGIHDGDILDLTPFQKQKYRVDSIAKLYPEYYILKVNDFDKVAKTPLEQWISYLKTGKISDKDDAPGLAKAREKLKLDSMSKAEQNSYYRHLDDIVILKDSIYTSREEGKFEGFNKGLAEGLAEGEKKKTVEIAKRMKDKGLPLDVIADSTGLSVEEIEKLSAIN